MAGAKYKAERLDVFTIVERTPKGAAKDVAGAEKKFWVKVGAAFINRDDSINIYLDALPANNTLHLRTPAGKED